MNWVQRKIYLYNVTFGLYMLDWWERYLFNILVIVLMWFIFYNSSRYVADFCKRDLALFLGIVREASSFVYYVSALKYMLCSSNSSVHSAADEGLGGNEVGIML